MRTTFSQISTSEIADGSVLVTNALGGYMMRLSPSKRGLGRWRHLAGHRTHPDGQLALHGDPLRQVLDEDPPRPHPLSQRLPHRMRVHLRLQRLGKAQRATAPAARE